MIGKTVRVRRGAFEGQVGRVITIQPDAALILFDPQKSPPIVAEKYAPFVMTHPCWIDGQDVEVVKEPEEPRHD